MQILPTTFSASDSRYNLGDANIDQVLVDEAVAYLKEELGKTHASHINGEMSKFNFPGSFLIPPYLKKINKDLQCRYYAEMAFKVSELKPSVPSESLLLALSKKISSLGIFIDVVELRFEKGCFNPQINWWHQDFSDNKDHKFVSICYSSRENWSTKMLSDAAIEEMGDIPHGFLNETEVQQLEKLATHTKLGALYDVKNLLHRSPLREDFTDHVEEEDYRLFIRFNKF